MPMSPSVIHAREQVERFVNGAELDRLAQYACGAADQSPGWRPGAEFILWYADTLYPKCLAPVEFVEYNQVDANAAFRRA
jgi:hypothetical protein